MTLAETEKSIEFTIKYSGAQDSQFCAIQIQKLRENRKFERISNDAAMYKSRQYLQPCLEEIWLLGISGFIFGQHCG